MFLRGLTSGSLKLNPASCHRTQGIATIVLSPEPTTLSQGPVSEHRMTEHKVPATVAKRRGVQPNRHLENPSPSTFQAPLF